MAALICLVVLNCALAAALFRRIAGLAFGWMFLVGFIIYVFLLYSEPHFYIVYRIDVFMHISFFVMLCGTWILLRLDAKHPYAAVAIPFLTALLAFLCKETLGLTALGLGFVWLLFKVRERGFWLAAAPGAATALGLALALLSDRLKNSPFTAARRVDRFGGQREQRGDVFEPKVPGLLPLFVKAAHDNAEYVRYAAAYALADTLDPAALPTLREMLNDPSRKVRVSAACLLTEFHDASGLPELKKAVLLYAPE